MSAPIQQTTSSSYASQQVLTTQPAYGAALPSSVVTNPANTVIVPPAADDPYAEHRASSKFRRMRKPLFIALATLMLLSELLIIGAFIAYMALSDDDSGRWWETIIAIILTFPLILLTYAAAKWRNTEGRSYALMFMLVLDTFFVGMALRVWGTRVASCGSTLSSECSAAIATFVGFLVLAPLMLFTALALVGLFRTTILDNRARAVERENRKVMRPAGTTYAAPGSFVNAAGPVQSVSATEVRAGPPAAGPVMHTTVTAV